MRKANPEALEPLPEFGRYASRYMHMRPGTLVSLFQIVLQGTPLARIGSTGRSAVPHLHFEMHDSMLISQDPLGGAVKPNPMDVDSDGNEQSLTEESDDGRCVHSTNTIPIDALMNPARFPNGR